MDGVLKGRGATINPAGRFARTTHETVDDGWHQEAVPDSIATEVRPDSARTIISRNDSPDISFTQSINPYRGCEHGCIYCYARPSHAYIDLSPGIDFETRLLYKADAGQVLRSELARAGVSVRKHHARRQYRSLSAGRKTPARHARDPRGPAGDAPSGVDHHQGHARAARPGSASRTQTP